MTPLMFGYILLTLICGVSTFLILMANKHDSKHDENKDEDSK